MFLTINGISSLSAVTIEQHIFFLVVYWVYSTAVIKLIHSHRYSKMVGLDGDDDGDKSIKRNRHSHSALVFIVEDDYDIL